MSDETQYRQCSMRRPLEDGSTEVYVAYLPTKFAKVGRTVSLKKNNSWIDGYFITHVGDVHDVSDVDLVVATQRKARWVLGN
jgi:hypothetical protein